MEKIRDKRYVIAIALATAVVAFVVLWPPAAVESVFPLSRARAFVTRRIVPSVAALFRATSVAAENRALRRKVGALALAKSEAERLGAENARLRSALAFQERTRNGWIAAEVLAGRGGAAGVRRLVRLSKGSLDGVRRGAVAVVPEGLVGRVVSVTPHTCAVMLATDPSLRVACEIETGDGAHAPRGILFGGDDDRLELRYLTRASGLTATRARVVTSGLGGVFPKGIPVGLLVGLEGTTGFVQLAADLEAAEFVFIRRES